MKTPQLKAVPGGNPNSQPAPAASPRSARQLMRAGRHWKKRLAKRGGVADGFSWESDRVTPTFVHLELAQAQDGTLYLTDPNGSPLESLLVCRVTMAEAWNYIAARYLPPRLRRRFAKSGAEALAEMAGHAAPVAR